MYRQPTLVSHPSLASQILKLTAIGAEEWKKSGLVSLSGKSLGTQDKVRPGLQDYFNLVFAWRPP